MMTNSANRRIEKTLSSVAFKGAFRDYQQTALDNAQAHVSDGKIHIVAAPGSGKTVLGLELIRRLNKPTMVLSPSVTIRQQWGERFEELFLPEEEKLEEYVSYDLKTPRAITSVTYQALHAASRKETNEESSDIGGLEEEAGGKVVATGGKVAVGTTEEEMSAIVTEPLATELLTTEPLTTEPLTTEPLTTEPLITESLKVEDFGDFDLIQSMKELGIEVLCLDEAHHLRSEWHNALVKFIEALGDSITVIALTATPPFDSTSAEWKRYEALCGTIDEEIFVPELVMKKTLCPHQDYIYFSYPTLGEKKALEEYNKQVIACLDMIVETRLLERAFAATGIFTNYQSKLEVVLKNEDAFAALFRIAERLNIAVPKEIAQLTKRRSKTQGFSDVKKRWADLELGLQFILDTPDLFSADIVEELHAALANHGLIERRKLRLANNSKLTKMLLSSMGKLQGLTQIVLSETANMGDSLRMLILTDYIKKEMTNLIGSDTTISTMGAVPIFEAVRRRVGEGSKIALLTGSLVIVPNVALAEIKRIAHERGVVCTSRFVPDADYSELSFQGSNKDKVSILTRAFQKGLINIMIGTKSLLGEGWDSPCINSLILATFVGSFMLSNQMRGRAIRIDKNVPSKTANIWHLVTLEPVIDMDASFSTKLIFSGLEKTKELSGEDWNTMIRRFDCFMGPAYLRDSIESGIERIDILKPPFDEKGIEHINEQMTVLSHDRDAMAARWSNALPAGFYPRIERASQVPQIVLPTSFTFFNALPIALLGIIEAIMFLTLYWVFMVRRSGGTDTLLLFVLMVIVVVVGVLLLRGIVRASYSLSPRKIIGLLAEALLRSMRETGIITSLGAKAMVSADPLSTGFVIRLRNAPVQEQNVFAQALGEMLSPIQNPKFVLVKGSLSRLNYRYSYACPSIMSSKKETAEILRQNLSRQGRFELVYTYSELGRKTLWKCCCHSFVNVNEEIRSKLMATSGG